MKRLLTVVTGLIAIEVLLIWLYLGAVLWEGFASAFTGSTAGEAKQALLVGAVSVVIWLGFVWGVDRLVLAVVACVVVTYAALVATVFVDFPAVVVCERGTTADVEVSSTRTRGYFESHPVGPCVLLTHKSRPPSHTTHGAGDYSD